MLRTVLTIVGLLTLAAETLAAEPVPITACGQAVPAGRIGVLMNDLACPPWGVCYPACPGPSCFQPLQPIVTCRATAECPDPPNNNCAAPPGEDLNVGLYMGRGARLQMNGHTISGSYFGIISGTPGPDGGVYESGSMRITGPGAIIDTESAVQFPLSLKVEGITVQDNKGGLAALRMKAKDVVSTGNQGGLGAEKAVKAVGITATGNGFGVASNGSIRIANSTITGNTSADIASVRAPRVRAVTCETSFSLVPAAIGYGYDLGAPWGVCSND